MADACDIETCHETLTDREVHGKRESSHSLLRGVSLRSLTWGSIAYIRKELLLHFGLLLASLDLHVEFCSFRLETRSTLSARPLTIPLEELAR